MNKPIKQAMHDMYSDVQLSKEELDALKSLAETYQPTPDAKKRLSRVTLSLCAMVFTMSISLLWLSVAHNTNRVDEIVADAIDNHLQHNVLEYKTQSIDALAQVFSYLGIIPISTSITEGYGKLMGARPCFILGMPAAQLRYQPDAVRWATVFQTRYKKEIYGELPAQQQPLTITHRGVSVSMWIENEVLVVTAVSL